VIENVRLGVRKLLRKVVSGIMMTLLLIGVLALAFSIQPVKADWTWTEPIDIRFDGSVYPDTAPILSVDNVTYTLKDNIVGDVPLDSSAIRVFRSNIVVDGAGYALQGAGAYGSCGIQLVGSNVTIKNTEIRAFYNGISVYLWSSNNIISGNTITNNEAGIWVCFWSPNNTFSNNIISGNTITNNEDGIRSVGLSNSTISGNNITNNTNNGITFESCYSNTICGNHITANNEMGIWFDCCYNSNIIYGNNITNNDYEGIGLRFSPNNTICGNHITANNWAGIGLYGSRNNSISGNNVANNNGGIRFDEYFNSPNNTIYHNNFIDNGEQVNNYDLTNVWDDGYPSGGNYWSDYEERYPDAEELYNSGIWDTPYVIDENNQDNYPLMEPWTPPPPIPTTMAELKTEIEELCSTGDIDNQGVVRGLVAKLNVAQRLIDKWKIEEAESILEEDFIPQVQNLSGIHITPEAADILMQSAEYILTHL
jgi:parallel beta-helix repeat protein